MYTIFIITFAEREGFEPPVRLRTSVFKTDAIDHSAIFPRKSVQKYCFFLEYTNLLKKKRDHEKYIYYVYIVFARFLSDFRE